VRLAGLVGGPLVAVFAALGGSGDAEALRVKRPRASLLPQAAERLAVSFELWSRPEPGRAVHAGHRDSTDCPCGGFRVELSEGRPLRRWATPWRASPVLSAGQKARVTCLVKLAGLDSVPSRGVATIVSRSGAVLGRATWKRRPVEWLADSIVATGGDTGPSVPCDVAPATPEGIRPARTTWTQLKQYYRVVRNPSANLSGGFRGAQGDSISREPGATVALGVKRHQATPHPMTPANSAAQD